MTQVRYWAAAKAAAGTEADEVAADTLAAALAEVRARHGADFAAVLSRCSFLLDGSPAGGRDPAGLDLRDVETVEVLPPFAGG
jgi:sulfur-carrier protein